VATGGYIFSMTTVSIKEAKNRLTALTRNGKPVFDLVPHPAKADLRLEAIDEFKKKHGIARLSVAWRMISMNRCQRISCLSNCRNGPASRHECSDCAHGTASE
jgi:antitoxin (DNA-binding transcriptional repressor) of toxin-antitoxin stability system